ncbi:adenine phosphoribosyltransferase isoform X2 [Hyalella azteca]|uniref:adenine phosphoribosyltransferase n=1 Tax=Hyalella azteca TaxID=294128 RepID=A0A979FFC7_HYAAZ|nr:adenine phosphoribosyltransferase isoform X2 [Hyalella azteca]
MVASRHVLRDIFSVLNTPSAARDLVSLLESHIHEKCPQVDVFVGLESRGFLFGLPLSTSFFKPFIPIRKKGKLPGKTKEVSFKLEYGEDVFEIQAESIKPGQCVVILDDLLATGGSLKAANELVSSMGGTVGLNLVCIELKDLQGRNNITSPVQSVLQL